ncbi:MAG: UvrD-helicase domain-containing protein [Candidatus Aminicenantes bacterium]|nr:UvrD-helicase domain-containing protein [Candidatus Aminicenantes bacterium]
MKNDMKEGLNPKQAEAVSYFDSPLLIIAGAGSGKTKVISHKIAYLINEKNFSPANILGVTFTNKAANEMKKRIESLTGIASSRFNISTFHALGLKILRESGHLSGFDQEWQVMDDSDQKKVIARIIKENFDYFTNDMVEDIRRKINLAKMNLNYPNNPDFLMQKGFNGDEIKVFSLYYNYRKKNKVWDYEDLVSLPVKLLQTYEDLREKYADRFKYVLVDEFQDTNPNQYELIKEISGKHKNITVVGDDDQAIYSWRGASIRFLFNFEHDFPRVKIIKLEQNYRSTQQILDFANDVIVNNAFRRNKSMWTEEKNGQPVFIFSTNSKEDEAEKTADLILSLKRKKPDIFPLAILYRINSQSFAFETEFLKRDIDFKILKGQPFFARKEVKDSLSLLKFTLNPNDNTSFLRVIDFIPLGIGSKTLESLNEISAEKKISLLSTLKEFFPEKFTARPLFAKILELNQNSGKLPFSEILGVLLEVSGYSESLGNRKGENRLLNIEELLNFITRWEQENPGSDIHALLDRISLGSETKDEKEKASVYLLTMHNAKGLEFPTVVVSGINSTYMPFFLRKEREEIDEERRLFYVAATRAIKQLVVSTGSEKPSRFLAGIRTPFYTRVRDVAALVDRIVPENSEQSPPAVRTVEEKFVEHPVFGRGKIIHAVNGSKYVIHFVDRGEKVIDTSIVPVKFL